MTLPLRTLLTAIACFLAAMSQATGDDDFAAALPDGVQAVWEVGKVARDTTATRERICINGLWRWQPAGAPGTAAPGKSWGYFKVPGCWPGITDYMQKDSQTVFAHPKWKDQRLASITAAWYEREFTVPAEWAGRRIALSAEYLNSHATVYVDGKLSGELKFPGGVLDLTADCQPGIKQTLSLLVEAMPLKAVLLSYNDTNAARETRGNVARRGLCGDVWLVSTPKQARISDIKIDTSVRKGEITFDAALEGLAPSAAYTLLARITANRQLVRGYRSQAFRARDLTAGRIAFAQPWKAEKLWDLHTPMNQCELELTLEDANRNALDTSFKERFGFREFWIDGKDFYLNGSRIHLSAVPIDNAQVGAALANYAGAVESLQRLKSIGINFVYTHNYGCQPGDHLSFVEILRAADDVGMLVALSQPHFSHYDWQAADADEKNGYARHAEFYVRQAQNHPAVVAYSTSHNACGYSEDMNPDMIDGIHDPRSSGELNNVRRALRAEAIIKRFDPGRIVYHHAGGNIGAMHTINFYPNFVPTQEMSDWFGHWATNGVKPVFTCEYGTPFSWDWAMYRGWYTGERSFGSARVPWDFCLSEWNAQFFGDRAFQTSEFEKDNLRYEAKQLAARKVWNRWDYPHDLNSKLFEERYPVIAQYITDNWRAFRTWGVSAISPWEHGMYWKLKDGVDRGRKELIVDWEQLQRPGFSPDYTAQRYERMDLAYERSDWEPTEAAKSLLQNNMPLLGYIAGKAAAFTSKDHLVLPGEFIEKQLIIVNDSRETVTCDCEYRYQLDFSGSSGSERVSVAPGDQARCRIGVGVPPGTSPGRYTLNATFKFSTGETQEDAFTIDVLPSPRDVAPKTRIAFFDPLSETSKWLADQKIDFIAVPADADLSKYDILIIGKGALTATGPAPHLSRVRDGLKVLVFEQTAESLEKRLGFRVVEYGLRNVFRRIPDHPLLAGLTEDHLRDWRGEATLLPPQLKYKLQPRLGPTVEWCGMQVPHLWRCGNRGNVASVLIEKPVRGDFLPILDGGYSLQYSPLMEYRDGQGMILFCQMDVTGRTETDPAAETLARNLLRYVDAWQPAPHRLAVYVGDPAGKTHLESTGIALQAYDPAKLTPDQVLIVGPGSGQQLSTDTAAIAAWLKAGGHLLAIGLSEQEMRTLPFKVTTRNAEHISTFFEPPGRMSPLAGVGPADVHNREPKELPLITGGATVVGDGVLAHSENGNVVFCQLAPWMFGGSQQLNHRKTFRRSSFLVTRLLANAGVSSSTPIVPRLGTPVDATRQEKRWQDGLYLDQPDEWDDPYRHFRW